MARYWTKRQRRFLDCPLALVHATGAAGQFFFSPAKISFMTYN
jgi:hypothetical protein